MKHKRRLLGAFSGVALLGWLALGVTLSIPALASPTYRSPLVTPYATTSIWNLPIGKLATYSTGLTIQTPTTNANAPDVAEIVMDGNATNNQTLYQQASSLTQCSAGPTDLLGTKIPIPNAFNPVGSNTNNHNDEYAILQSGTAQDIAEGSQFSHCATASPADESNEYGVSPSCGSGGCADGDEFTGLTGNVYGSITGDGLTGEGGVGGSGLSTLGGVLRGTEIQGAYAPHVLRINVDAAYDLQYDDQAGATPKCTESNSHGYVWPATRCDRYGNVKCTYSPQNYPCYSPSATAKMGSLMAIPRTFDCSTLTTTPAQELCQTFEYYGGYISNDSRGSSSTRSVFSLVDGNEATGTNGAPVLFQDSFDSYWAANGLGGTKPIHFDPGCAPGTISTGQCGKTCGVGVLCLGHAGEWGQDLGTIIQNLEVVTSNLQYTTAGVPLNASRLVSGYAAPLNVTGAYGRQQVNRVGAWLTSNTTSVSTPAQWSAASGDVIVVSSVQFGNAGAPTFGDSNSDSFTTIAHLADAGGDNLYIAFATAGASLSSVTVSYTSSTSFVFSIQELTGVTTLANSNIAQGSGTSADSGTIPKSANLYIGVLGWQGGTGNDPSQITAPGIQQQFQNTWFFSCGTPCSNNATMWGFSDGVNPAQMKATMRQSTQWFSAIVSFN